MKQITYKQWCALFDVENEAQDAADEISEDSEGYEYFDNGAVRDATGDFVIKTNQVGRKQ